MKKTNVRKLVLIPVMAALLAICSWIVIPFFAVPFTMQTFAIFAALLLLGGRDGTMAIALWMLLGAVGVPVFSGFGGGLAKLLGPTGGYIFSFLATGLVWWLLEKPLMGKKWGWIVLSVIGMILCYGLGTWWFVMNTSDYSVGAALGVCVLPFIVPDAAKIVLAWFIGGRVRKALHM